jgi:uncharacterized SAM-binding protein YcdF (DUF218 family)
MCNTAPASARVELLMLLFLKALLRCLILPPSGPLLLAILGILLLRRRPLLARICLAIGIGSLWVISVPVVADAMVGLVERYPPLDWSLPNDAQAIVILGGGGQIKRAPEYGGPSAEPLLLEKLAYGAFLSRKMNLPILVTGAPIEGIAMRDSLRRNFNIEARWVDNQARDTFENAHNSVQLLTSAGVHRIVLITRATHMWRSVQEFIAAGMQVVPAPVGIMSKRDHESFMDYLPQPSGLLHSYWAIYESLGDLIRASFDALHVRRQ